MYPPHAMFEQLQPVFLNVTNLEANRKKWGHLVTFQKITYYMNSDCEVQATHVHAKQ
jgi:hypothetical protein